MAFICKTHCVRYEITADGTIRVGCPNPASEKEALSPCYLFRTIEPEIGKFGECEISEIK